MNLKSTLLLMLISGFVSCRTENTSKVLVKNAQESEKEVKRSNWFKVDFTNEDCKLQIDSAKIDVTNGKLVCVINSGFEVVRYDSELEELLLDKGLQYLDNGPNCTGEQECYKYYMDSIIMSKYGNDFIRKIEDEADSLFLSRWETKFYQSWDIDRKPTFKREEATTYLQKNIMYPSEWDVKPMKDYFQLITVNIYVTNKGSVEKWEMGTWSKLKASNKKLLPYLKSEMDRIILEMKEWNPGELEGRAVNSKINLIIYLGKENVGYNL